MQKHGGQTYEGPEEILVCIVDDSYGKPSDLDEEQQYQWYKEQLEKEFSQKFEEVDVAPGYSLPAFATIVQITTEYWPALVATFFSCETRIREFGSVEECRELNQEVFFQT